VTTKHVRGAAVSEFAINGLFDRTYWNSHSADRRAAFRAPSLLPKQAATTPPRMAMKRSQGRIWYPASRLAYNTGAPATLNQELCPVDGGNLTPGFGVL
jgi:hypothetical protein